MNTLKSLRASANITQQSAADKCGINIRQYQAFESGERDIRSAAVSTVLKIAKGFGVTVEELLK